VARAARFDSPDRIDLIAVATQADIRMIVTLHPSDYTIETLPMPECMD